MAIDRKTGRRVSTPTARRQRQRKQARLDQRAAQEAREAYEAEQRRLESIRQRRATDRFGAIDDSEFASLLHGSK